MTTTKPTASKNKRKVKSNSRSEPMKIHSEKVGKKSETALNSSPANQDLPINAMLTRRETQILKLIADGFTSKEAAEKLKISPRTVEVHRANIMKKLRIRSLAGLIKFALRTGIASL